MTDTLVFGTGSVGSVYASILCRAGVRVTCVCRSNYDSVKSHGLRVTSTIFGQLQAHPAVARNVLEATSILNMTFSFVLVCTKATSRSTSVAIESIRPAITLGATTIVLIQNGLGVERPFQLAFPDTNIISGVAYLPTIQTSPGAYSHSEVERLHLGLYVPPASSTGTSNFIPATSTSSSGPLHTFARLLQSGGATALVSHDIQAQRWTKLLSNATLNPICALSRCRDRQLIDISPPAADLIRTIMNEIAAVGTAAGYGHVTTPEAVEIQFARSMDRPYPGVEPSTLVDVRHLRPLEVQAILGEVVRIAGEMRIEDRIPRLSLLCVLLEGLDFALQEEREGNLVTGAT